MSRPVSRPLSRPASGVPSPAAPGEGGVRRRGRRVLVVEDSVDIGNLLRMHLADIGCRVEVVETGEEALDRTRRGGYDLVILDLMLPGMDGVEVCRALRTHPGYVPILMLTARSSELDRVLGLEMGADDYVAKPFGVRELLARVNAIFRRVDALERAAAGEPGAVLAHGRLRLDPARREVWLDGAPVALTAREFDLLAHFMRHPGRVYSRSQLLDQVWGYQHEAYEHTVNSHINRLRAKIEPDPAHPVHVVTVWGVGYKLAEDAGGEGTGHGRGPGPSRTG